MDPFTAASVIGTVLSVGSAIQQGKVASANATNAADVATYNSKVAEGNAVSARSEAAANEEAQRRSAAVALGRTRAAAVESGTGLDGSTGDLVAQSMANADLDAKNILYAGELKGQGLDSEALQQKTAASQYRSNASSAITGSYLTAAGAAFAGGGNYYKTQALSKVGAYV